MECENVSVSSVFRILRFDLYLTAKKISFMQHVEPTDIKSQLDLAMWIERLSHELNGQHMIFRRGTLLFKCTVNKQNMRFRVLKSQIFMRKNFCMRTNRRYPMKSAEQ
jgi:hypothetical protein